MIRQIDPNKQQQRLSAQGGAMNYGTFAPANNTIGERLAEMRVAEADAQYTLTVDAEKTCGYQSTESASSKQELLVYIQNLQADPSPAAKAALTHLRFRFHQDKNSFDNWLLRMQDNVRIAQDQTATKPRI